MAHQRKLIRQAVVALLIAAGTAAEGRVLDSRVDPLKQSKLPAITVYTLDLETVDQDSAQTRPRKLKRYMQLDVVGFVDGVHEDAVATAMDDLAEQIEAAMDADRFIGGKVSDSVLTETIAEIREGGRSSPLIGIVALTYNVTYYTEPTRLTPQDEFLRAKATQNVVGGIEDDTEPVVDQFTVQGAEPWPEEP